MQCLAPITEMRDHYLLQKYASYKDIRTKRDDFNFSNGLYLFYKAMFKGDQRIVDLYYLKNIVIKKFQPIM